MVPNDIKIVIATGLKYGFKLSAMMCVILSGMFICQTQNEWWENSLGMWATFLFGMLCWCIGDKMEQWRKTL